MINLFLEQESFLKNSFLEFRQKKAQKTRGVVVKKHFSEKSIHLVREKQYRLKFQYVKFSDNENKPTYYGIRKSTSKKVNGRRPFVKDDQVDYEADSDEEWEELQGEDIEVEVEEENEKDEVEEEDEVPIYKGETFISTTGSFLMVTFRMTKVLKL
jgi:hypothetical protein